MRDIVDFLRSRFNLAQALLYFNVMTPKKSFSIYMMSVLLTLTGVPFHTAQAQTSADARSAAPDIESGDPLTVDAVSGLNVRKRPNAERIGAIPNGRMVFATGPAQLHRTGRAGMQYWLPIRYQNESNEWIEGWIYLRHASPTEDPAAVQQAAADERQATITDDADRVEDGEEIVVQAPMTRAQLEALDREHPQHLTVSVRSRARFRADPSLSAPILGRLTNDTAVEILGRPDGEWIPIRVAATGQMGWMHMTLLEAEGTLNPLELAGHNPDSIDLADDQIDAYAATVRAQTTEGQATAPATPETCADCGGRPQPVPEPLPVVSDNTYISPIRAARGSGYGPRRDPITGQRGRIHRGIDFPTPTGTEVHAVRGGRVIAVKNNCRVGNRRCGGGWGNHVIIDHGGGITSVYAHLQSATVRVGDTVTQGQVIARSGSTGRSTGPHLHLEIRVNNRPQNPANYLNR